MPEGDLTRWVGIRPTDPSENIPVTESAPLTSIEVEPTAGSANFPVTESAPLTDILVAPSAGNPQFETVTQKRTPAIADLQAIESFVRVTDYDNNVGAPNYNQDVYTVPAGKIFFMQMVQAQSAQADPTFVSFALRSAGVDYVYYTEAYGVAWKYVTVFQQVMYNEGEIVRITWSGTLAGTDVIGILLGYLLDKY